MIMINPKNKTNFSYSIIELIQHLIFISPNISIDKIHLIFILIFTPIFTRKKTFNISMSPTFTDGLLFVSHQLWFLVYFTKYFSGFHWCAFLIRCLNLMESQDVCLIQHIFFSKNQEKFIFKHKKNEHWVNIETLQNISHVYDTKITV